MDCQSCGMETELRAEIQGRRFTPHGIEDILRRDTRIVVGGDSEVDRSHGRDSEVDSYRPLNMSKCYQTCYYCRFQVWLFSCWHGKV